MSVIFAAPCDLNPADEWQSVGAHVTRDAVNQRTGAACISVNLNTASADGMVGQWGGGHNYAGTVIDWYSAAAQSRFLIAYKLGAKPLASPAYGPIRMAFAVAGAPYILGVDSGLGNWNIYNSALSSIYDSGVVATLAAWVVLMLEWDHPAKTIRLWEWNAGTSVFDLKFTYVHGSQLCTSDICGAVSFGWFNGKAAGISTVAKTDDIYWCDSAGDFANTRPSSPAEVYAAVPSGDSSTYNAWTEVGDADGFKWDEVDDLSGGGANDGDTTYCKSGTGTAEIKQAFDLPNSFIAGVRPVQAVGLCGIKRVAAGTNGDQSHLLRADSADATWAIPTTGATYGKSAVFFERTPSNKGWNLTYCNELQVGMIRGSGASAMRDVYLTAMHVCAVECSHPRAFGKIDTDSLVPASWAGGSRRFGAVPSTEVVTVGFGARRWGAVPSDESVPADSDWTS